MMNSIQRDLAEALRARLRSDCESEDPVVSEHDTAELLRAHIATLEAALAKTEEIGKHRERALELANSRVSDLQTHIATLETALVKAEAASKIWQSEAQSGNKRVNDLVAELFNLTSELVEMSKRLAQQTALREKLRADLEEHRSRSWWWKHGVG